MSVKKPDRKGRLRTEIIAFRASSAERKEIDERVKLCGYQSKQEYLLDSALYQQINATGNPLMFVKFRQHLDLIIQELQRIEQGTVIDDELLTPIRTMNEILKGIYETISRNDD